jgi:tetratricopeptide (TPR) repeat protein
LELLADDTRRILAAASVLGRRFELPMLVAVTRVDPAVVTGALREAITAELVREEAPDRYAFAHALVEATLYDGMTPTRRARLHRAAAEALERATPDDPPLAAIAYHFCRALPIGERAVAVDYARRAGADAAARGAAEQAVQHYERALEAARGDGEDVLPPAQESSLLTALGDAFEHAGQVERAQAVYVEAIDLARAAGDTVALAKSALALLGGADESVGFNLTGFDPAVVALLRDTRRDLPEHELMLRSLVTARLAGVHYDDGDADAAAALSAEALDLARASGDAVAVGMALASRHLALSRPETLPERLTLDDELRALEPNVSVQAEVWHIGDLLECGRVADADDVVERMATGPLSRTQPRARWCTALYREMRAFMAGRVDEAAELCEDARLVGEHVGARTAGLAYAIQSLFVARERRELDGLVDVLEALAAENAGRQPALLVTATWVRVETGRFDDARKGFEQLAAGGFSGLPRNSVWLASMRVLADVAFALDASDDARQLYGLLEPFRDHYIVTSRIVAFSGSVEHPLGVLALTAGDLERARDHLERARERHADLSAPILLARTELARAAWCDAAGDQHGARALRNEIRVQAEANGWIDLAGDAADANR